MRNTKASPKLHFSFKSRHSNIQTYEINLQLSDFSLFLVTCGKKKKEKKKIKQKWKLFIQPDTLWAQFSCSNPSISLNAIQQFWDHFKIIVGFQMLCACSTKNKKSLRT